MGLLTGVVTTNPETAAGRSRAETKSGIVQSTNRELYDIGL